MAYDDDGEAGGNLPAVANPRAPQRKKNGRPEHLTDEVLVSKFGAWDKALDQHWANWRTEAKEAYDVTAGRQWDKDAESAAEQMQLTTIAINKVDATVSAICGSEMTNRQEVRYYPRELSSRGPDGKMEDVVVNEIFTAAAEWIRDECDAADEESEAFRDCVICGIGATETRMDYEQDPEGVAIIMRVDPMELGIDSASRRGNADDAQYVRRKKPFTPGEAKLRFGIVGEGGQESYGQSQPHRNYAGSAYMNAESEVTTSDVVWITEYQWWELEKIHRVLNPRTQQIEEIADADFQRLLEHIPELEEQSYSVKVRRYYRAFCVAERILECTPLPDEEFTYKFITGKLDRNKGVWYGVVRAMIEPQRLLNKQVSQIQRIIDNNAKGGLLAEIDAFENPEQAKLEWAGSDTIVYVKPGTLGANPRVMPKPVGQYPTGIDKLLAIANEAVPGVSGVNNEMLGIIDREQAGVVDVQRKEAAYGVLKSFFNSLRRYRKMHGRHLLKLISKYMTDGRLVRIVGRTGNVQYLPLIRDPNTIKYDIIVDEAPTGPNQKEKVFQFLAMFGGPLMSKMNLPPQIMLKFLEFSPLPTALVAEIMQMVQNMPPTPNPDAEKAKGEAAKLQGDMQKIQMDAQISQMEMQMEQQRMQMEQQAHAIKAQVEMSKLQGDNKKLEVENQWVQIEMAKTQMDHRASEQEAMLRARETAMREQNDSRKIEADIQKMGAETQIKHAELEIKRAELQLKQQELGLKGQEIEVKKAEIASGHHREGQKIEQADRHADMKFESDSNKIDAGERMAKDKNKVQAAAAKKPAAPASSSGEADVAKLLSELTEALKKPRKVMRDAKTGRAVGIE